LKTFLKFITTFNFFFQTHKIFHFKSNIEYNSQVAYEHYDNWLNSNNTDHQIGANYLTNRQLFWVAAAFSHFTKHNKRVPHDIDQLQRVRDEFLHVNYKINKGFQRAFSCNFTESEKNDWFEYQRQLRAAVEASRKDNDQR
jgi:hypothetical protein